MMGRSGEMNRVATIPEVLDILEERKKGGELGYEQQLAYEHVKKFSKLTKAKAEKLRKELEGLGLSEKLCVMIVDIMPTEMMQLKQIAANEKRGVDEAVLKKVMEVVESYRGK